MKFKSFAVALLTVTGLVLAQPAPGFAQTVRVINGDSASTLRVPMKAMSRSSINLLVLNWPSPIQRSHLSERVGLLSP